jgi:hypothetical protein
MSDWSNWTVTNPDKFDKLIDELYKIKDLAINNNFNELCDDFLYLATGFDEADLTNLVYMNDISRKFEICLFPVLNYCQNNQFEEHHELIQNMVEEKMNVIFSDFKNDDSKKKDIMSSQYGQSPLFKGQLQSLVYDYFHCLEYCKEKEWKVIDLFIGFTKQIIHSQMWAIAK